MQRLYIVSPHHQRQHHPVRPRCDLRRRTAPDHVGAVPATLSDRNPSPSNRTTCSTRFSPGPGLRSRTKTSRLPSVDTCGDSDG
ncbi:MAG: hypothetical protein NZM94_07100 [Roseiflexus sp.]|nr:hypothetical protein [Roseiflexus sp.]